MLRQPVIGRITVRLVADMHLARLVRFLLCESGTQIRVGEEIPLLSLGDEAVRQTSVATVMNPG